MDEINSMKRDFDGQFKMTDLEPCQYYLIIGMTQNRSQGFIYQSLSTYITNVSRQF